MPAINALISKSKLRPTCSPRSPVPAGRYSFARASSFFVVAPVCRKAAALASPWRRRRAGTSDVPEARPGRSIGYCFRLCCGLLPHAFRQRHRLVGALQELDGHEDHVLVAEIFEVVDLELAGPIGFVPGF